MTATVASCGELRPKPDLVLGMALTPTATFPPAHEPADTSTITRVTTSTFTATLTLTTEPTATPTPEPMPTNTPTPTPTPAPLTAAQVFERVSPSVAFIQTPIGVGSGALIEGGYVVTNAHVVWPFQNVRVVFPDGTEYSNAPVLNWDLMGDLAVIGPIPTSITPLVLADGEASVIGSDTFLIGYPGEVEEFPQPTITRGLISRLRQWEPIGMTYFQTDATIAGGQSGGVLVSDAGGVIGISGFTFTEAGFGLVASAADVLPRIEKLIAGEDVAGLGDRHMPQGEGQLRHELSLHNFWDQRIYVINETAGTAIDIEVESEADAAFGVFDFFGNAHLMVDHNLSGVESGSVIKEFGGPYFLLLGQSQNGSGSLSVSSNVDLTLYHDPDDGKDVSIGQTIAANIDSPLDTDYFNLVLYKGETVEIEADSILIDTILWVDFEGAADEQVVSNDDGGGGLFGMNAKLTYQAPVTGSYIVAVGDANATDVVGGYFLTVSLAPPGAFPVPIPMPSPTTASFDATKIREALSSLPQSFIELAPEQAGASIRGFGLEDFYTDIAVFSNHDPFEFLYVLTGRVSESDRELIDAGMSSSEGYLENFMQGVLIEAAPGVELTDSGVLNTPQVGDASVAVFIEINTDGVGLAEDVVQFRRGNILSLVFTACILGSDVLVSAQDAAVLVDAGIKRFLEDQVTSNGN